MRTLLLSIAFFSLAFYSCKNDGKTENGFQDSILIKNDSAASEVANEIAIKEEKKIYEDSLKQTTAAKFEDTSFEKALPDPNEIFWNSDCGKYLKKLGFKGSSHPNDWGEFGCKTGTYTLRMGDKKCKVFFDDRAESAIIKITITGDEKALDGYYKRAKKLAYKGRGGEIFVKKKGNTVIVAGNQFTE